MAGLEAAFENLELCICSPLFLALNIKTLAFVWDPNSSLLSGNS